MKNKGEIVSDEVLTKPESEESVTDNVSTNPDLEKNLWCAVALFSALNPKNICNNIRAKKEEKRQKREQEKQERKEKALQEAAERKERYRKYKDFVDSETREHPLYWSEMYRIHYFIKELIEIENTSYDPYDVAEEYDSLEQKRQRKLKHLETRGFHWLHIESLQYLYGFYELHKPTNRSWWTYCWCDRITNPYFYRFPSNITNLLKKYWFTYGLSES